MGQMQEERKGRDRSGSDATQQACVGWRRASHNVAEHRAAVGMVARTRAETRTNTTGAENGALPTRASERCGYQLRGGEGGEAGAAWHARAVH